jgi:uncharacterized protein
MPDAAPEAGAAPETGASGRLLSFTVIRKPPAAFADEAVYAVCIVTLDDGRRATGRLAPFEPAPELGAPVRVVGRHKGVAVFAAVG